MLPAFNKWNLAALIAGWMMIGVSVGLMGGNWLPSGLLAAAVTLIARGSRR